MNNKNNAQNQMDMFFNDEPATEPLGTQATEAEQRRLEKIQAGTLDALTGKRKLSSSANTEAPAKQGEARTPIPDSRRRHPQPDQYGLTLPDLLDAYDHFASRVFNTEKLRRDIATVRDSSAGVQQIDQASNLYHQLVILERRLQDATDQVYGSLNEKSMTPVQVGHHMVDCMSAGNGYGAFACSGTSTFMPSHWFKEPEASASWTRIVGRNAGDLLELKTEKTVSFSELSSDIQNLLMSKLCSIMDPEVPIAVRTTEAGIELKLLGDCSHSRTYGTLIHPYRADEGQWARGYVIGKLTEDRHLQELPESPIYISEELARNAARKLYWTGTIPQEGVALSRKIAHCPDNASEAAVSAAVAAHNAIDRAEEPKRQLRKSP